MIDRIKERIEVLEKEIEEHQTRLIEHNQALAQLQSVILSKQGAVFELKKLIDKD